MNRSFRMAGAFLLAIVAGLALTLSSVGVLGVSYGEVFDRPILGQTAPKGHASPHFVLPSNRKNQVRKNHAVLPSSVESTVRPPCANPKGVGVVANNGESTVSFLNLELNQECERLDVSSGSIGASVTPDGTTALVSSFNAQQLHLFDLTVDPPVLAGTIDTTTLTESVCISPDSRFAVTADGGPEPVDVRSIAIAQRTTVNSLSIDGATGCVISDQTVALGFFTVVIADFNNNLFRVLHLDATTGTLTDPDVSIENPESAFGLDAIAISARGRSLAIATNFDTGNVTILTIDNAGQVTVVGTPATGSEPGSLAIAPNGETAWVVNHGNTNIAKLAISPADVVTDTGIRITIPGCGPSAFFGASGIAVKADSTEALVSNACADTLQQLDIINNEFTGVEIAVGSAPAQIGLPGLFVPPAADLSITKTDSPDPVEVGNNLTYTITVTNNGPDAATGTVLTDALPAGVTLVSATPSQGSCSGTSTVTCNLGTLGGAAVVTFLGPTPYLSQADSPFDLSGLGTSFFLEDFEDGLLNTPGISASAGIVVPPGFEGLIDSVDGDDGAIDGSGLGGHSFFSGSGSTGLTFTFDAAVLGFLPTHAGIVWTDGAGTTTFEAFDAHGMSLGTIGPVSIADSSFSGTTTEDRFFGVIHPGGLSAIKISNTSGGIEVDHLQYGQSATNTSPASAMVTIVVIPTAPGTITNTASVTSDVADPDEMNNTPPPTDTTVWSLLFGDGTTSLGINTDTGDFTLTYLADGEPHVCSGTRARVGDGFLTISDRCTPDLRDRVRATGAIDGSITLQLLDRTGPAARDRVIRHFSLTRTQPPLRDASRRLGELVAGGWECEGYCGWQ